MEGPGLPKANFSGWARLASALVLMAAVLASLAASAAAAGPSDPDAGSQQPLRIMKGRQAVAAAGHLADVNVLVADTGLDLTNPDIAPRLYSLPSSVAAPNPDGLADPGTVAAGAPGWDLIGTEQPSDLAADPDPTDPPAGSGHGTEVAGLLGAAWSPTNMDVARVEKGDRVLCLNPTGSLKFSRRAPLGAIGSFSRSAAAVEAAALRRRGAEVTVVSPDRDAIAAMGVNLMSPSPTRRDKVLAAGFAQGRRLTSA